jgi:hypothetical protein
VTDDVVCQFSPYAAPSARACSISSPGRAGVPTGGPDDRRQLHDGSLDGGAVSALAGDQDVVAVVGGADADRLQDPVAADRVRELLKLAIIGDRSARVEPVRETDYLVIVSRAGFDDGRRTGDTSGGWEVAALRISGCARSEERSA